MSVYPAAAASSAMAPAIQRASPASPTWSRYVGKRADPGSPVARRVHRAVAAAAARGRGRAGRSSARPISTSFRWSSWPPATPRATSRRRSRASSSATPGCTYRYGRPLGPHPIAAGPARSAARRGARSRRAGARPPWCSSAADPAILTPTPSTPRSPGCCRRAAGSRASSRLSSAWPSRASRQRSSARAGSAPERIVVLPYFLFAGVLPSRTEEQAREWAAAHPAARRAVRGRHRFASRSWPIWSSSGRMKRASATSG